MTDGTVTEKERAEQAVNRFVWRFSPSYRLLACHAALPLVLTPELLNYLRNRFLRGQVPWVAEADLLLSDLCRPAGYEQYVMDPAVRDCLLGEMRSDPKLGPERMEEVARLLISYTGHLARTDPFALRHELQAMRWAAMVFVTDQRESVGREIEKALNCFLPSDQIEADRLRRIIDTLVPYLPAYDELQEYAARVTQIVATPVDQRAKLVDEVYRGLDALADLMRNPDVFTAVVSLRTGCEAAWELLEVVRDYKHLHDLLHELQFQCYSPLSQEAPRFPDDDLAMENVIDHELTLGRIISDLKEVAERVSLDTSASSWLQSVREARDKLAAAIEHKEVAPLNRAVWLLRRVLTVQPARVTASLMEAARATDLPGMVERFRRVHDDHLAAQDLDPEKLGQFREGLKALDDLSDSLSALVTDQDRWQTLDVELRRIEDTISHDVAEPEMSWPCLKSQAEALYSNNDAEWATSLKKTGEDLGHAITKGDPVQIKRSFRLYRRQAAIRFYQVDTDLKRRCDELCDIGKKFTAVMRPIQ